MNNQFIKGENDWMSGTLGDDVEMTRDVFLTTRVVAEMKDLLNRLVKKSQKSVKKYLEIIILLEITFTA